MAQPAGIDRRLTGILDRRPLILAVAGPNGAGKSTFFAAHLASAGLRFINADELARGLDLDAYEAARLADALRWQMLALRESFVFETVFSDPVGAKLGFLKEAVAAGYTVALCYIGIASAARSDERVAMRVTQGGHDVPTEKLNARFPRTLANLAAALNSVPLVYVFDHDDLATPFRLVSIHQDGRITWRAAHVPEWLPMIRG